MAALCFWCAGLCRWQAPPLGAGEEEKPHSERSPRAVGISDCLYDFISIRKEVRQESDPVAVRSPGHRPNWACVPAHFPILSPTQSPRWNHIWLLAFSCVVRDCSLSRTEAIFMRSAVSTDEHPEQSGLWTVKFSSRRKVGYHWTLIDWTLVYCFSYTSQPFLCKSCPNCTRPRYGGGASVYSLGRLGERAPSAQPRGRFICAGHRPSSDISLGSLMLCKQSQ